MIFKVIVAVAGLMMVIWPHLFANHARRRHDERLADLAAGGDERYFEERRALEAYPPMAKLGAWRLLGGLLALGALSELLFNF
jgi:hypothetical protein